MSSKTKALKKECYKTRIVQYILPILHTSDMESLNETLGKTHKRNHMNYAGQCKNK